MSRIKKKIHRNRDKKGNLDFSKSHIQKNALFSGSTQAYYLNKKGREHYIWPSIWAKMPDPVLSYRE